MSSTYLSNKNTIEKARILYKSVSNAFNYFISDINKLKDKIDNMDTTEQIQIDNLLNMYDTYLSDLFSSVSKLLILKKNIIGDNSLIIKSVDKNNNDYSTEIWYSYNTVQFKFMPKLICKYDNFSFIPIRQGTILLGYNILIGTDNFMINSSNYILDNVLNNISPEEDKNNLKIYLSQIILIASNSYSCCMSNEKKINNYLHHFDKFYSNK